MIGRSAAFRSVLALIDRVAAYEAPVIVEGETGTGKELAARAIHDGSVRRDRPFVPVNCGSLPDTLVENELFGHRRGAFTDARDDQPGLVALADTGTLFLDEIDALSARGQIALLRFLQDFQYRPLGGRAAQQVDVRIIAATNGSLARLVAEGHFRQDLLYRLDIMHVRLPPLRERTGDAPLLAEHFLDVGSARFGSARRPLHPETIRRFEEYAWPGNVRELENTIYRGLLLTEGPAIRIPVPAASRPGAPVLPGMGSYRDSKARAVAEFERRFLTDVMERVNGNVTSAALLARTDRRHLGRLLKKHGLDAGSRT
jgi:DNA-binding NtrC family response regulator